MAFLSSVSSSLLLLLLLRFLSDVTAEDVSAATITTTMMISEGEVEEVTEDNRAEEMRDQAISIDATNVRNVANPQKKNSSNPTKSVFMPSVHLGPIASSSSQDEQRQTTKLSPFNVGPLLFPDEHKISPFNSLSAIKFGDGKENLPPKHSQKLEKLIQPPFRPSEKDANFVKFIDDKQNSKEDCTQSHKVSTNRQSEPPIYHHHVYVAEPSTHPQATGYTEEGYESGQQQYTANYETKPTKYDATSLIYSTPYHPAVVQGQHEAYHHHHNEPTATIMKPEMIINVQHPMSIQAASYDPSQKPKTVIYVSHDPHQFYHQPQMYNHLDPHVPEHEETYPIYYDQPQYKSLSPWKKILHIIGAFLPLGLLFALLPNVLKTNTNSNNPSIVLSKLRVNDLTREHKRDQLQVGLDTECREERSICRLLEAADNAGFDFLRNLVIRIAEKTAEPSVRKKELDRIFEAAKLGNCDILTCDFYDGT